MTSPVAIVGLTYDGEDLQDANLSIFFEIKKGLNETPSVRGEDVIVPALTGRIERNRVKDVIRIELVGFVQGISGSGVAAARSAFRTNMQTVRSLFAPSRARADLVATLENSEILSISARPLNIVTLRNIGSELAELSIELEGYGDWAEVVGS